ncbi:protein BREAKING OF ASYMMETRY IN THE STOMATAL LINEAGE isoform X2 [Tripterygium wilfordii]|uniref:protein BREAKING OF ASYMMETRY IN THE STOMATAL LINEAGE isoform X2 n=1 Tax=Tripterygium wilfordii TaxID=458696 RepID=UPI0018F8329D|nr:protein BREAKING OF ASYMMETRY IN THE STOMATAL LINEAGE isoform X2 [Tripterygium wilfordii]
MGTPWTVTRSIRWRMRDWASCFLACRFPLDEDHSTAPQIPIRKMNRHKNEDNRGNKTNHKRQSRSINKKDRDGTLETEDGSEESSWPHFRDEDYIVFCFRDDGAIDVLKESRSESLSERNDCTSTSLWPSRRKSICSENDETVSKTSHENLSHEEGNDICLTNEGEIVPGEENGKADGVCVITESPSCENRKRFQIEDIKVAVPVDSSDSNQSDGSAGSFSFPVLGVDGQSCTNAAVRELSFTEAQGSLCAFSVL